MKYNNNLDDEVGEEDWFTRYFIKNELRGKNAFYFSLAITLTAGATLGLAYVASPPKSGQAIGNALIATTLLSVLAATTILTYHKSRN